jgi:hypothetical protein
MSEGPVGGAFPHQHGDPRSLDERIEAQVRERIAEAVEMAALHAMVELRKLHGRPPPEPSSPSDRVEFEASVTLLLRHLRNAFHAEVGPELSPAFQEAEERGGGDERSRGLAGQALLARRLPDYWGRFEAHRLAHEQAQRAAPSPRPGFFGRWLGGG